MFPDNSIFPRARLPRARLLQTMRAEIAYDRGCDGSPITKMTFRVRNGVRQASPEPKDGWTTKATARIITFSGGSMPSDATDAFSISFTSPTTKGVLTWKVIQRCQTGVERWLEAPSGEFPAPVIGVGKQPPKVAD